MKSLSNYNKYPVVDVPGNHAVWTGWNTILAEIEKRLDAFSCSRKKLVIECYPGILDGEVEVAFRESFKNACFINASEAMLAEEEINEKLREDITDDEVFGYITRYNIDCYFDPAKVARLRNSMVSASAEVIIVYGVGAAYIAQQSDLLVYADLARWEIQMRFRKNRISNIGVDNKTERPSLQYKRAFFVDWRICDRFKKKLMRKWDYVLDTNIPGEPKMITGRTFFEGLREAVRRPFRVVPFFDPGPWGGQWMKEVCDLDREKTNYAWCFDCVPEENSLLLRIGAVTFEIPALDLVFAYPRELLGEPVYARFGDEFPIRFDFLDTMKGGNLSLQVHPSTEYIREKFGMHYTQDESYYLLDAEDDAAVYLGLQEHVRPESVMKELEKAQATGAFDAEKYIGRYPVKKHMHVSIPAGTVHCSGKNAMVLEISATPYIFTFKVWDWGRLGLDGRPRPIHMGYATKVIRWDRTESWVRNEIFGRVEKVAEGDGWVEERTGLHESECIETRRHWFSKPVLHRTNGCVHVLNLIEGREVLVESPSGAFEPYTIHYAETFIVPGSVTEYTIRPYGESEGKRCGTIKAYIRNHA